MTGVRVQDSITEKVTMYLRKNYTWLRQLPDKPKYSDDLWASCWHSVDINGEITTSQVDDCAKFNFSNAYRTDIILLC